MTMPTWISEFQAFATVAVAGGVGFIGFQQFRIAKRKLQLDLYDRRWSIYNAMRGLLVITYKNSEELQSATLKAYEKKAEARFLLDSIACDYVDNFVKTISEFNNIQEVLKSGQMKNSPEDAARLATAQMNRTKWLMEQYEPLIEEFSRFLRIDHVL